MKPIFFFFKTDQGFESPVQVFDQDGQTYVSIPQNEEVIPIRDFDRVIAHLMHYWGMQKGYRLAPQQVEALLKNIL